MVETISMIFAILFRIGALILFIMVLVQYFTHGIQPTNMDILILILAAIPDKD